MSKDLDKTLKEICNPDDAGQLTNKVFSLNF